MPRITASVITLVAAAGLAACGSSTAAPTAPTGAHSNAPGTLAPIVSSPAAATDACSLASSSDVTTAFGGSVASGVADTAHHSCSFAVTAASFGADCTVTVDVPNFPTDRQEFNDNEQLGGSPETVSGIGDAAYKPEQGHAWVQFVKGNNVVDVMLKCTSDPDDQKEEAAVETLAKAIAARM